MRKLIKLYLLSILTGCSPVNPIGLVKETASDAKVNKNPIVDTLKTNDLKKTLPQSAITSSPKSNDQIKSELIYDNSNNKKPKFDSVKPIEDNSIRSSDIVIFFKDNAKIRLKGFGETSFKSLNNLNTDKLNQIIAKYNISAIETNDSVFTKSEETLQEDKKNSEKYYGSDYPNIASIYYIHVENINVKAFIEELRKNEYVLSANENTG